MTRRAEAARLLHEDRTDYQWPNEKLDELLADPAVREAAEDALLSGFDDRDRFQPEFVYAACRRRHRRKEAAALLFFLAYRVVETARTEPGGTA